MTSFSTVGAEAIHRRGVTAADIPQMLGDSRRDRHTSRCRCPLHDGRSLTLRDGDGGCILVTCWAAVTVAIQGVKFRVAACRLVARL